MIIPLYDTDEKNREQESEPELFQWAHIALVNEKAQPAASEEDLPPKEPEEEEKEKQDALEQLHNERLKEAEESLKKARKEAESIRDKAKSKGFKEGRKEGYEEGYDEGLAEGKRAGRAEYDQKMEELEKNFSDFLKDAERAKQQMLDKYLDDLKEIALVIGEKIVRTSLRTNSSVVERMILAATEKLKKSAWAKIYIANTQEEGQTIQADAKFLQELAYLSDHIKIVLMDGMEPGTCIIERPDEIIDISVGAQLENIREIMSNARV